MELMSVHGILSGKGAGLWGHSCPLPALFVFSIELFDAADDASLVISFGIFNKFYGRST